MASPVSMASCGVKCSPDSDLTPRRCSAGDLTPARQRRWRREEGSRLRNMRSLQRGLPRSIQFLQLRFPNRPDVISIRAASGSTRCDLQSYFSLTRSIWAPTAASFCSIFS